MQKVSASNPRMNSESILLEVNFTEECRVDVRNLFVFVIWVLRINFALVEDCYFPGDFEKNGRQSWRCTGTVLEVLGQEVDEDTSLDPFTFTREGRKACSKSERGLDIKGQKGSKKWRRKRERGERYFKEKDAYNTQTYI